MAVIRFDMPDLGEGLAEVEIVEWHVGPGDRVVADQPLVSVETDKAVVEIPAPASGALRAVLAQPGDVVGVGAPLAEFDDETRRDAGAVVGELPLAIAGPRAKAVAPPGRGVVRAMPAARARARTLGRDLATIGGTGPEGVVMRADVAGPSEKKQESDHVWSPLTGARRSMASRMDTARAVVRATLTDVADVSAWFDPEADVLFRLARAMTRGVAASPGLNAWFDAARIALSRRDALDLGLAVDTESGLYVPVIRDVGSLDAAAFRAEADRLVAAAHARALAPADTRDATLTLSSFGTLGGRFAELVVTPPQVAILGAGRVFPSYERSGERLHLPLSLSFDHRAATGGDAARFLAAVIEDLAQAD